MTDYVKMLNKHLHLDHISLGYAILTFNSKIWMWFLSDEMMIGLYLHNVDYENVYKGPCNYPHLASFKSKVQDQTVNLRGACPHLPSDQQPHHQSLNMSAQIYFFRPHTSLHKFEFAVVSECASSCILLVDLV